MRRAFGLLLALLITTPAHALTEFYLDPDFGGGTKNGQPSTPFSTLDGAAWTIINNALVNDNVTLYCSARNASSDTDQSWPQQVFIDGNKTANPSFTLTIDGNSKWNSNDASPFWQSYAGTSKCTAQYIGSQNSSNIKYNKVTINGMKIIQTGDSKGVAICGDNWTVQNSDISHSVANFNEPLVLIVPTADALHQGSSSWCPQSGFITISTNQIHDSHGEAIYGGGAGCIDGQNDATLSDAHCGGKPGHHDITITNNTIFNCGKATGGEGDCIDIKAAITNLTISLNDITGNASGGGQARCIVFQGIQTDGTDQNILVERNKLHNCLGVNDGAIAFANSWGTVNGATVRNNIIDTVTSSSGGDCITVYATQSSPGMKIYSNTLYNCQQFGISTGVSSTLDVKNNALLANNGGGTQNNPQGATWTVDHNAFGGSWSGTCTACVSGLTSAAFTNASGSNFTLPAGSALLDVGATIGSFSNDYAGTTRPQGSAWDIGAFERLSVAPAVKTTIGGGVTIKGGGSM